MLKRVNFIERYQNTRVCSKFKAVIVLMLFSIALIIFSAEIGLRFAGLHKYIYRKTENDCEIQLTSDEIVEHYANGKGSIFQQMSYIKPEKMQISDGEIFYYADLKVEPGECLATSGFHAKAGQRVDVSAGVEFIDVNYEIGILDKDGYVCYVQADGAISHNFNITREGEYHIYVKNGNVKDTDDRITISYRMENYF